MRALKPLKPLKPLLRLFQRSLRAVLLRRVLAWLACAAILIIPGGALAQPFGNAGVVRLGLILAAFSALPAFLLWPPAEKVLTERLRLWHLGGRLVRRLARRVRSVLSRGELQNPLEPPRGKVRVLIYLERRRLRAPRDKAMSIQPTPRCPARYWTIVPNSRRASLSALAGTSQPVVAWVSGNSGIFSAAISNHSTCMRRWVRRTIPV